MSIDNLKHKHGEVLNFNIDNKQVQDLLKSIIHNQTEATLVICEALVRLSNRTLHIPCKQCMLDAALQFRDVASSIEELLELQ